jgi:hypothetical protein
MVYFLLVYIAKTVFYDMPINIYLLTYMYLLKRTNNIQKLVSYVDKNVDKISPRYQSQKFLISLIFKTISRMSSRTLSHVWAISMLLIFINIYHFNHWVLVSMVQIYHIHQICTCITVAENYWISNNFPFEK